MKEPYQSAEKCRQYMRSPNFFKAILDQAERDWRGGPVNPVYRPTPKKAPPKETK
jgi:hypothetical protein